MQLTRREFLQDMAFVATVVGLPNWMTDVDEAMPLDHIATAKNISSPWQWSPANDLAQGNPSITALNRIAFGPRPGDYERVQTIGVDAYIEEQLAPDKIDDTVLDQKIAQLYPTLAMSNADLMNGYPQSRPTSVEDRVYRAFRAMEQGFKPYNPQGPTEVIAELQDATVMRALYSKRQLNEVLVGFWSNHFSIYAPKNDCRWFTTTDNRDVIRKNALGKFGDLLLASAQSSAMLEYLDNRLNVKGVANENYAREIMELHSLGVNGGYTQKDVSELARAFTGWGITAPKRLAGILMDYKGSGVFEFNAKQHDDGAKTILGINLPANGGINDATKIIDVLAHHPSTAQFVSRKLVRWFVADNPPATLVDRAVQTFTKTDGDMRAVLNSILHSDEFKSSFGQKIKKPFELVVSGLRAVDAQLDDTRAISALVRAMGQGSFVHVTPDGYPDNGTAWINAGALLQRWNYGLMLGSNRVPRAKIDAQAALKNVNAKSVSGVVDQYIDAILHRPMPDQDRQKIIDAMGKPSAAFAPALLPELVALILASPHFQFR